jgi:archaeal type IV pilus assembly protein PilA
MIKKCNSKNASAVSPVVGVMLMLVVTIIIAAVVSAFAGGLGGSQTKTPQATIVSDEFHISGNLDLTNQTTGINYGTNQGSLPAPHHSSTIASPDVYLLFEHQGGDPINLNNIELRVSSLQKPSEKSMISNANTPLDDTFIAQNLSSYGDANSVGDKSQIPGFSKSWSKYMERYPDHGSIVKAGDKFVVHADYVANLNGIKSVDWMKDGAIYPFYINSGDVLTYQIVDKPTGRLITSGQIEVPEISG